MARTSNAAKAASVEAKAKAADNKSEGMRMLFDAGYAVKDVAKILDVGYAFAYGVAKRAGVVETAANRRPVKAKTLTTKSVAPGVKAKMAKATKAPVKATAKAPSAAARVAARLTKATNPVATVRKATAAEKKALGRPTAARREANRAPNHKAVHAHA